MFPFYSETRKADVVTDNYLYPFFHLRQGVGLNGWQFWPVAGYEHKDVTLRTNLWHETETVAGHDKRFVLWPLYFDETAGIGTTNQSWQQASLPAYSVLRSPLRDSTTVLWPFFSHITEREKKYREWDAPWPLIEYARGEGKTTTRVWPFFSRSHNAKVEDDFYLWPVYKYDRAHPEPLDRERRQLLFFLYSDIKEKNTETGANRRRVDLWPLLAHQRDFNGNSRWQALALLETFVHGSHKMDRDYSPVWSVWRSEKNPRTGAASQSLLWNLYRREVTPAHKRVSVLFGLFQRESDEQSKRASLFYIPISQVNRHPEPHFK
jgi:hypothetical protein